MDPYCQTCEVFHARSESCEVILERRARVRPVMVDQLRLVDPPVDDPKVLCIACGAQCYDYELDARGRCDACTPPLDELLEASLRRLGVEPRY